MDGPCATDGCKNVADILSSAAISCQSSVKDSARPAIHPDPLKDNIHFLNSWTKKRGLEEDSRAVPCSMDDVPPDHHRTKVRLSASAAHMPSADDLSVCCHNH